MTEGLAAAMEVVAALAEVERPVDALIHVTPVNAAQASADFERSNFPATPVGSLRRGQLQLLRWVTGGSTLLRT
jgi:hypothetical protein